jgi:hypothetical protein
MLFLALEQAVDVGDEVLQVERPEQKSGFGRGPNALPRVSDDFGDECHVPLV